MPNDALVASAARRELGQQATASRAGDDGNVHVSDCPPRVRQPGPGTAAQRGSGVLAAWYGWPATGAASFPCRFASAAAPAGPSLPKSPKRPDRSRRRMTGASLFALRSREMAPPSRLMTADADPPHSYCWLLLLADACGVQARGLHVADRGTIAAPAVVAHRARWVLLRTRLRAAREQGTDLSLPVPAVTAQGTDRREFAGLRPPRHGLGIHAKHRRNLGRRQKRFSFGCACRHVYGLSSRTSTAILRCGLPGSWMEPVVDVPYDPH